MNFLKRIEKLLGVNDNKKKKKKNTVKTTPVKKSVSKTSNKTTPLKRTTTTKSTPLKRNTTKSTPLNIQRDNKYVRTTNSSQMVRNFKNNKGNRTIEDVGKELKSGAKAGAYIGKKTGNEAYGGLAGIEQAGSSEIVNALQKGQKSKKKGASDTLQTFAEASFMPIHMLNSTIEAGKNFAKSKKSTKDKLINLGLDLSESMINTKGIELAGKLAPKKVTKEAIKTINKADEAVSKPYEKNAEKLNKEAQKYNKGTQVAGDVFGVVGRMAPSIGATALTKNPNVGLVTMGVSAKGSSTKEALNKGADLDTATKIGTAKGLIEVGTEKLTGGLHYLGKGSLDDIAEKGIQKTLSKVGGQGVKRALLDKGLHGLYDVLGENLEETITDIVDTQIDKATVDPKAKYTLGDWGQTVGLTTASTILLNLLTRGMVGGVRVDMNKAINQTENQLNTKFTDKEKNILKDNALKDLMYKNAYDKAQDRIQENKKLINNKIKEAMTLNQNKTMSTNEVQRQKINDAIDIRVGEISQLKAQNRYIQAELDNNTNFRNVNLSKQENITNSNDFKQKQLEVINKSNPMYDEYHTGIRNVEDIKSFNEAYTEAKIEAQEDGYNNYSAYPDITNELLKEAVDSGEITVYSSYPIEDGVFVTPSLMQATDYAGGDMTKVYSETVPLSDVAWINVDEGQYAKVDNNNNLDYNYEGDVENDGRTNTAITRDSLLQNEIERQNSEYNKSNQEQTNAERNRYVYSPKSYNNDSRTIRELFGESAKTNINNKGNKLNNAQINFYQNCAIRNFDGNLLIAYHGTNQTFDTFDKSKIGSNTGNKGFYGTGFYFTENEALAHSFNWDEDVDANYKPMAVYLNIENPFYWNGIKTEQQMNNLSKQLGLEDGTLNWNRYEQEMMIFKDELNANKFAEALQKNGYDGIVYKHDHGQSTAEIVAFEPNQIKSVDNLNPTNSDNIYDNNIEELDNSSFSNEEVNKLAKELDELDPEVMAQAFLEKEGDRLKQVAKDNNIELTDKQIKQLYNQTMSKANFGTIKRLMLEMWENRNYEIDRISKITKNKNIKFLGDHINNMQGEIETNLNSAQIDGEGNIIGESLSDIFRPYTEAGEDVAFNDYLFHKSNIERHKNGVGSQVPMEDSTQLVKAYESKYPNFKDGAKKVNNYNRNLLKRQVQSGLISQETADNITRKYEFYVPFYENQYMDSKYVPSDSVELKSGNTLRRAQGGADANLLLFQDAMAKQTQQAISNINKNELYKEIVNTLPKKAIDVMENVNPDEFNALLKNGKKYYLTAFEEGTPMQVEISQELFNELNKTFENQIKSGENALSVIWKPIQKANNIKRNLVTTWSPSFMATNMIKDIQDAFLNTKYTKDFAKAWPTAVKEMVTGKDTSGNLQKFLNMYGKPNIMGDYSLEGVDADVASLMTNNGKVNRSAVVKIAKKYLKLMK